MTDLLRHRSLLWLRHVCRIDDGRIPKDLLFSQLATGTRARGRPQLRYKDVCKWDLLSCGLKPADFVSLAANRTNWISATKAGIKSANVTRQVNKEKRKAAYK